MSDPTKPTPEPRRPSDEAPVAGRRRVLQSGLAAAPVLMTLVSRPVLGQGNCTSPSSFFSANASNAGSEATCSGHTPEYWANPANFSQWPTGFKAQNPQGTRFGPPQGVFNNSPYNGNPFLLDALTGNVAPSNAMTDAVAKYVSAAVLNSAKGLTPVLSVQQIKDIWAEYGITGYGAGGYYSPTAGAKWFWNEIVAYLKTTMPS
jgi:hypothetical protein